MMPSLLFDMCYWLFKQSVLGLVKVVIARLPAQELDQHLKSLVEGLILWSDDSKNHFKAKVCFWFTVLLSFIIFSLSHQLTKGIM